VSNADFNGKKTMLVLFINGRPVDCSPLKRALEATYAAILPKAAKPWIFLVRCVLWYKFAVCSLLLCSAQWQRPTQKCLDHVEDHVISLFEEQASEIEAASFASYLCCQQSSTGA